MTGSFTRAADRCHLSQSAFSRSIAMLESDLSATLVDRVGRRCELTAVGQSVLEHARHVVFEAEELARAVAVHAQGFSGNFRLGMGSTPGALVSGPLLAYVANACPGLRIAISRGHIDEQLAALRTGRWRAQPTMCWACGAARRTTARSALPTPPWP